MRRLKEVVQFAKAGDKRGILRIGGVVDRDFRTPSEISDLQNTPGLHVLGCHEEENLYLEPSAVQAYVDLHVPGAPRPNRAP